MKVSTIKKNIIKPLLHLSTNNAIVAGLSYALTISLANILGPSDFGIYNIVFVIGSILTIVIPFGTDQTAAVTFSKSKNKTNALSGIIGIRGINIFITFTGILFYSFYNSEISIFIFCTIFSSLNLSFLYESKSKNISYSYIYLFERLTYILLIIIITFSQVINLRLIFLTYFLTVAISLSFQIYDLRAEFQSASFLDFNEYISIAKSNYPLVVVALASYAYGGFSRIILDNNLGSSAVGIFSLGWQLVAIGTLFQAQVNKVWRFKIANAIINNDRNALKALVLSYFSFTFVPLTVIASVFFFESEFIVKLLFSASYQSLKDMLPILSLYLLIINLAGLAEMLWIPLGKNSIFMAINVFFGSTLVGILYYLSPALGVISYTAVIVSIHFISTIFLLIFWHILYKYYLADSRTKCNFE